MSPITIITAISIITYPIVATDGFGKVGSESGSNLENDLLEWQTIQISSFRRKEKYYGSRNVCMYV